MKGWKSLLHFLRVAYTTSWKTAAYSLLLTAEKSALPIITTVLSARLLGQLTSGAASDEIGTTIFLIIAVGLAAGMVQPFLANRFATHLEKMKDDLRLRVGINMLHLE